MTNPNEAHAHLNGYFDMRVSMEENIESGGWIVDEPEIPPQVYEDEEMAAAYDEGILHAIYVGNEYDEN